MTRSDMTHPRNIAVIDVGKTNVKLVVTDRAGAVLEMASAANPVRPGPPWDHHDLPSLGPWVMETLAGLARRHPVAHVIPTGHGVGTVLVGADPDGGDGSGTALPMMDYEQPCPEEVDAGYRARAGSFADRGSEVMQGSTHTARQLWRMQVERPEDVARAAHVLHIAQYWAWWLSGVPASEHSMMGAQSHLRNLVTGGWSPIVEENGWARLLPPFRPAWEVLGPVRPALARRYGLPEGIAVHTGAHDSSTNLYRYLAGGLDAFTLVSTGTWIVGLAPGLDVSGLSAEGGMSINSDMEGRPVAGALSMGAGEFVSVRSQRELLAASTPDTHDADTVLRHLDVDANELALVFRARGIPAADAQAQHQGEKERQDDALGQCELVQAGQQGAEGADDQGIRWRWADRDC